jgi:hypothetical protein
MPLSVLDISLPRSSKSLKSNDCSNGSHKYVMYSQFEPAELFGLTQTPQFIISSDLKSEAGNP